MATSAIAVHKIRRGVEQKKPTDPRHDLINPGELFKGTAEEIDKLIKSGAARKIEEADKGAPVAASAVETKAPAKTPAKTDTKVDPNAKNDPLK